MSDFHWSSELTEQLSWHWTHQQRPRLSGLTDEEYFWEPAPGGWSVRPRGQGVAIEVGAGDWIIDWAFPPPDPPPVTTIAWRLGHLLVGVFALRNATHFGEPPVDYDTYAYPGTAAEALDRLDTEIDRWVTGVRGSTDARLIEPSGEPGHESDPLATLVLHINREAIHHLAEIALLRDLFRAGHDPGAIRLGP